MRIQHNIMAMNAYRNYTNNTSALSKNLEKLSSGYKINRAGDDAAGLAISEKMRAQITGLEAAQKNAKDGISLVQTAEGALTEVHDMLNRMVYLATQSANGTYDNETDRYQLQKEMDQLNSEIDRIADSANFNGIKLLDGSMDGAAKLGNFSDVSVTPVADGEQNGGAAQTGVFSLDLNDLTLKLGTTSVSTTVGTKHTNTNVKHTHTKADTYTYTNATGGVGNASTGTKHTHTVADTYTYKNTTSTTYQKRPQDKTIGANDITFQLAGQNFKDSNGNDITDFSAIITDVSKAGTQIADALDGGTIDIDGTTYDVTAKDGKITLKGQAAPTTDPTTNLNVTFTATGGVEENNNGWDQSVHVLTAPVAEGGNKLAQGSFTLNADMIKNGSGLKIGKETYVFQVGDKNPITAGAGQKVIKLTEGLSDADALKEAADKLSQQNNEHFHITTNRSGTTIHLTEKAGKVDYEKDWDLQGTTGNDTDAPWKSVVQKASGAKGLTLQIGDTADDYNKLTVNISDMHAKALGIDSGSISIANQEDASKAIDAIKNAINMVSDVRGTLGATQNRLDHTINNLSVMTENIQDAESTIRDTDIAEEMMAYTKNNILIQSAQAMLAQANQVPQGVLQLLQ